MPRNKMVWRIVLLSGLSACCAKLIHSSLREQSNGNGHLSSLKMKLIFPLRDIERSAKMCDSLFHCDCSEGTLADVHSFSVIHCLHFSPCLMSELTLQNNRTTVLFFISLGFFFFYGGFLSRWKQQRIFSFDFRASHRFNNALTL